MKLYLALIGTALIAAACATRPTAPVASANLQSKSGSSTTGTVSFSPKGDGVMVTVDISGLKPNAEHGFHVHEKGDCSGPEALNAGGHFNPAGKKHGAPTGEHHAGDIPNLKSDPTGRARGSFEVPWLSVGQGPADVIGRSVVVHRDADDYKGQPAGNSGPRIACGVIRRL
jgi:Cu-Zn family superoxide dismutase